MPRGVAWNDASSSTLFGRWWFLSWSRSAVPPAARPRSAAPDSPSAREPRAWGGPSRTASTSNPTRRAVGCAADSAPWARSAVRGAAPVRPVSHSAAGGASTSRPTTRTAAPAATRVGRARASTELARAALHRRYCSALDQRRAWTRPPIPGTAAAAGRPARSSARHAWAGAAPAPLRDRTSARSAQRAPAWTCKVIRGIAAPVPRPARSTACALMACARARLARRSAPPVGCARTSPRTLATAGRAEPIATATVWRARASRHRLRLLPLAANRGRRAAGSRATSARATDSTAGEAPRRVG